MDRLPKKHFKAILADLDAANPKGCDRMKKREPTFDFGCFLLAEQFLEDEPDLATVVNRRELAAEIQATIESFIEDKRRNPPPQ